MPMKIGQHANYKVKKFCVVCGNEKTGWIHRRQKTCSAACASVLKSKNQTAEKNVRWGGEKKCLVCGNSLDTASARRRKTCSLICSVKSKLRIGKKHPRWGGEKKCVICGAILNGAALRKNKTCSAACTSILVSNTHTGSGLRLWEKEVVNCKQCGKEITHRQKLYVEFCSRKCSGKWQSKNLSKEHSPLWRGGSAYGVYPAEFNAALRSEIRKRDKQTCQSCGKRQIGLDIHHIDENKQNSSPKNLITLCRSCHRKAHWGTISMSEILRQNLQKGFSNEYK